MGSADRWRIAIVGSGSMARTRASDVAATARAQLIAVASRNPATGAALAAAHGCDYVPEIDALLARPDLDAVIVCTHNASHAPIATAALESGRHALVEYPLALDPGEGARAVDLARARGLVLQVGYDQVWLGPHGTIRTAVERHGMPLALDLQVVWPGGAGRSAFRNSLVGGTPGLAKSYYLYAALDWLGQPLDSRSTLHLRGADAAGHYDAAVQTVDLRYAQTSAHLSWVVGPPLGVRQRIRIELLWPGATLTFDGRSIVEISGGDEIPAPAGRSSWQEATRRGFAAFLDLAEGRAAARTNAAPSLAVVRMLAPS